MLAKLFNNISIQSLIRAGLFVFILLLFAAFFSPTRVANLAVLDWEFSFSQVYLQALIVLCLPIVFWLFNHRVNTIGFLKLDYQLLVVLCLLIGPLLMQINNAGYVITFVLGMFLLMRLFEMVSTIDPAYILFDAGVFVAIMSLLVPETTFLLLIIWLATLTFGQLNIKTLLMPLLAIIAVYFMVFTILYWLFQYNAFEALIQNYQNMTFGFDVSITENGWVLTPLVIVAFMALAETMQVYGKANVKKRQIFTFLLTFFLLSAVAGFTMGQSDLRKIWPLIPMAFFTVNLIHYQRKEWLKTSVYGLLLLFFILVLVF